MVKSRIPKSGRSRRVQLTPPARRDLTSIVLYSEERWGVRQSDSYTKRLNKAMERLTRFPLLGISRSDLLDGVRARPVAQHIIFYRVDEDTITVLRLLHHSIDERTVFARGAESD